MATGSHTRALRLTPIVPILAAAPFLMRFRQCLLDNQRANALKYLTALPPLALSHYMKFETPTSPLFVLGLPVWHLWLFFLLLNASYSFYWDVYRDWDLDLRRPDLRAKRVWEPVELYWAMVPVDLILRLAWAFKLSSHLSYYYDLEAGLFLLEILEVMRRFLWVFFRVEAEHFRVAPMERDLLLGNWAMLDGDRERRAIVIEKETGLYVLHSWINNWEGTYNTLRYSYNLVVQWMIYTSHPPIPCLCFY